MLTPNTVLQVMDVLTPKTVLQVMDVLTPETVLQVMDKVCLVLTLFVLFSGM